MSKTRVKWLIWSIVFILIASFVSYEYYLATPDSGPLPITVSKETTYILGPVNKDGTVNYLAYLKAKGAEGVTKENNAAIPLIEILGPDFLDKATAQETCKILGIKMPDAGKKYFVTSGDYEERLLSKEEIEAAEDRDDLGNAATKPWNAKQYPVIAEWLQANDDALNAMLTGMQRTGFYMPVVSPPPQGGLWNVPLPHIHDYIDMGKALSARAMLKLDSGDAPGAWADLITARRLASRTSNGSSLVERLVALAIDITACEASRALAGSGKLTAAQARAFLADMQRLKPLSNMADAIDETERLMTLDCIGLVARETRQKGIYNALTHVTGGFGTTELWEILSHRRDINWDYTLRLVNFWYDSFRTASREKTFQARQDALDDHNRRLEEFHTNVANERSFLRSVRNHFGDPTEDISNILILMLIPAVQRALVLHDRDIAQGDLTIVTMALAAYQAENNTYPDKLSQLSPEYLKKVPDDLFIDKPFGYTKTDKGYLLYSVAENMKYDDPKIILDKDIDDIVVEVK